jgi:acetylornithine deacetylase/succinyl-diaminopimelate desuccinylase-like protein
MGNIFAVRNGTAKDRKPIAMGSHLDTQPAGTSPDIQHYQSPHKADHE